MNLEELVTKIHDAGIEWIEAKLRADQLEEDAKNFLAAIMNALEAEAKERLSESKLERLARGSKEFRDYVVGMCAARADATKKKLRYESLSMLWEAKRSELAFERVKVEKGIFHEGR